MRSSRAQMIDMVGFVFALFRVDGFGVNLGPAKTETVCPSSYETDSCPTTFNLPHFATDDNNGGSFVPAFDRRCSFLACDLHCFDTA